MNAKAIVSSLLEDSPEDSEFDAIFRELVDDAETAARSREESSLKRFKDAVYEYVKWMNTPDEFNRGMSPAELSAIRKSLKRAKSFREVEQILRPLDDDPSFLSMIKSGFFV